MTTVKRLGVHRSPKGNKLATIGGRIGVCFVQIAALRQAKLTLSQMGALLAQAMDRKEGPYGKTTLSGWLGDHKEPNLSTIAAIAELAECDPEWIAWGRGNAPLNVRSAKTQQLVNQLRDAERATARSGRTG